MTQRRNQTSAQSGIYRVSVPVPHEHRQHLRTLAHEAGARSFSDLVLILVQSPEEAGKILAPLVLEIAGTHWKEQALERVKAAAAREGLSLTDLHHALFGHDTAQHPTSCNESIVLDTARGTAWYALKSVNSAHDFGRPQSQQSCCPD